MGRSVVKRTDITMAAIVLAAAGCAGFFGARLLAPRHDYIVYTTDEINPDTSGCPCAGAARPALTVVVYTDFALPQVPHMHHILDSLMDQCGSPLRICYRFRPIHNGSGRDIAARAAIAAHGYGSFLSMRRRLDELAASKQGAISLAEALEAAALLSLDTTRFKRDMFSPRITGILESALSETRTYGIFDYPSLFFKGYLHRGLWPAAYLQEKIERAIRTTTAPGA